MMLVKSDKELTLELGNRIRSYRIAKRISQKNLAAKAGIHENTLRSLEHGADVNVSSFIAVVRALGERSSIENLLIHPPPRNLSEYPEKSAPQRVRGSRR
jgi:transcriptional regulator with XRE-family HTH domain